MTVSFMESGSESLTASRLYMCTETTQASRQFRIDAYTTMLLDTSCSSISTWPDWNSHLSVKTQRAGEEWHGFRRTDHVTSPMRAVLVISMGADELFGMHAENPSTPLVHLPIWCSTAPAFPEEGICDYASLLLEIHDTKILGHAVWSWRGLEEILGRSHTQLQRIASRQALPSTDVAQGIDELSRLLRRLRALTQGNEVAMWRGLTTPRERDSLSALQQLERREFRKAFGAIVDTLALRPELAPIDVPPLRWYDEPSVAMHDREGGDEGEA